MLISKRSTVKSWSFFLCGKCKGLGFQLYIINVEIYGCSILQPIRKEEQVYGYTKLSKIRLVTNLITGRNEA